MSLKNLFPILNWLPSYKIEWIKYDIVAGFTIGVMLIPQGIAYALIIGLPPIYGLYTALIPQLVYAIFGTSRQLAVGPVAMDSLIVGSGLVALAEIGSDQFISFAILLAVIVGLLQVLFGLLRLGFMVNFLSRPVISGFTSAAALIIGFSQLNNLLGISLHRNNKIQQIISELSQQIGEIHTVTFSIGLCSIFALAFLKKYARHIPSALVLVIVFTALTKIFRLDEAGVAIVGQVPEGLPPFILPEFTYETFNNLLPIALTLSVIGFLEAISIAKAVAQKNTDSDIKPNQELFALGMGNIIGSFFSCFPATGGFSRTAVNVASDAKTPLSSFFAAVVIIVTLLFLTPLFYYLPKAVLAAIIIIAVASLIDFSMPRQLLKFSKADFFILLVTLLSTVTVGIMEGIFIGVTMSITFLIYKNTKPHIAVLGNIPKTHFYRNRKRFKNVEIDEELLIVRFDAELHFANTNYFKDKLIQYAQEKGTRLRLIILDGESINSLDGSAIFSLVEILEYFNKRDILIAFTSLKGPVRDTIILSGFMKKANEDLFFMSIQEAVDWHTTGLKKDKYQPYIKQKNLKKKLFNR